jgi:hypothetical protein
MHRWIDGLSGNKSDNACRDAVYEVVNRLSIEHFQEEEGDAGKDGECTLLE